MLGPDPCGEGSCGPSGLRAPGQCSRPWNSYSVSDSYCSIATCASYLRYR